MTGDLPPCLQLIWRLQRYVHLSVCYAGPGHLSWLVEAHVLSWSNIPVRVSQIVLL